MSTQNRRLMSCSTENGLSTTEGDGEVGMGAKKRLPLRNVTNERRGPHIGASNAMVRTSLSMFMALLHF